MSDQNKMTLSKDRNNIRGKAPDRQADGSHGKASEGPARKGHSRQEGGFRGNQPGRPGSAKSRPPGPDSSREPMSRGKSVYYFWKILKYFKPYIPSLIIMAFTYLGVALCNMAYPYLNGTLLYDRVLAKRPEVLTLFGLPGGQFVLALGLVVLGMILAKLLIQVLQGVQSYINAKIVPLVVLEMENQVFRSMGELSLRFFHSNRTGGLMTRVLSDASQVTGFFIDFLPEIFTQVPSMVATCVIMFVLNWKLALVSLCLLPVMVFLHLFMMTKGHVLFSRRHRAERDLTAKLNDNITGVRVVKSFGQEQREIENFGGANEEMQNAEVAITVNFNKVNGAYAFLENVINLLVWAFGSWLILGWQQISYGQLITFSGYVTQLNPMLRIAAQASRQWVSSMNAASRVFSIIEAKPEITESSHPVSMASVKGQIDINHVTFGYEPGRPVLKDISLHVEPGKMLGIVGRSGAGKTTLVNLISRLYEVEQGSICIDGVDIREFSFRDLRRNVSMVSQETYIFMGTVAENIAYAKPGATRQEIIRASVLASAHDFICKMPDGYDTMIGASGRTLSGGERQRISIARAILADPKILILDEATAAVDTETERAIQQSIAYLTKDRTTLSIAHRLSTLRDADYLVVIEHGRIAEEGTHDELIERKGIFAHLMELQTTALAMRGLE